MAEINAKKVNAPARMTAYMRLVFDLVAGRPEGISTLTASLALDCEKQAANSTLSKLKKHGYLRCEPEKRGNVPVTWFVRDDHPSIEVHACKKHGRPYECERLRELHYEKFVNAKPVLTPAGRWKACIPPTAAPSVFHLGGAI